MTLANVRLAAIATALATFPVQLHAAPGPIEQGPATLGGKTIAGVLAPSVVSVDLERGGFAQDPQAPAGSPDATLKLIGGTLEVQGFEPGAKLRVLGPSRLLTDALKKKPLDLGVYCRGSYSGATTTVTVDAEGTATLGIRASHQLQPGGSPTSDKHGACQTWVAIEVSSSSKPTHTVFVRTSQYELPQWARYVYEDTAALDEFFAFELQAEGASTCSGTSLGTASFPVGAITHGKDLALSIRSGPAGTVCRAASPGKPVSKDLRLVEIDWEVVETAPSGKTSKCCAGDDCMEKVQDFVVIAPGHLPSDGPGTYQGIAQSDSIYDVLGVKKPKLQSDQHQIGFAHIWLACDATLTNDHGVKVILRSATFEGPPGLELPH